MTDYAEVQFGLENVEHALSNPELMKRFRKICDAIGPDLWRATTEVFAGHRSQLLSKTYVFCTSRHDSSMYPVGRLSMWRGFAGGTNGIALIIRGPGKSSNMTKGGAVVKSVLLSSVDYILPSERLVPFMSTLDQIERNVEILRLLEPMKKFGAIWDFLTRQATCTKHHGFVEEDEWRFLYNPLIAISPSMEKRVEIIGDVPQLIYVLPLKDNKKLNIEKITFDDMLVSVIIGPTQHPNAIADAITYELSNAGVKDAHKRIIISDIPLRQ